MARATREALSRERILRAALAIIDRDGLDAVSMRRLGDELGVEAMSLYNHVANKAAVLDGVFELVLGELPRAPAARSWRAAMRERARALRAILRAHPNAIPIFATRPAVTPASLAHVESALEVLRRAGWSPRDALRTLQVLLAYVVGHTATSDAPDPAGDEAAPAYDRLSAEEFPRVREAAELLADYDVEAEFEYGLDALLDGLEPRRKRR